MMTVDLSPVQQNSEPEFWLNDCIDWTAKDIAYLKKRNAELTYEVDLKKLGLPNGSLLQTYIIRNSENEVIAINTKDGRIIEAQYRVHYKDPARFQNDLNLVDKLIQTHNGYLKPTVSETATANLHQTYTASIDNAFDLTITIYANNPGFSDLGFILLRVGLKN